MEAAAAAAEGEEQEAADDDGATDSGDDDEGINRPAKKRLKVQAITRYPSAYPSTKKV